MAMKTNSISPDFWHTSKKNETFIASKNFPFPIDACNQRIVSITVKADSVQKLHQLMKKIDEDTALPARLQRYALESDESPILEDTESISVEKFTLSLPADTNTQQPPVPGLVKRWYQKVLVAGKKVRDWIKPKNPLRVPSYPETDKLGIKILNEDFHAQGERPVRAKTHWLQTRLPAWVQHRILGILIPAEMYAEKDRQELAKRAKAAKRNRPRENRKTLWELREDFEKEAAKEYPEYVFKHMTIHTVDLCELDTFAIVNPHYAALPAYKQKWILFLHPADVAYESELSTLSKICADAQVNIYTGNYRGVGSSKGKPDCANDFVLDAEAMVQHLLSSGVLPNHILVHGFSIGGGVGTEIAALHPGMHLCNDRSFSKLTEAFHEIVPIRLLKKFSVQQLASLSWELDSLYHLENVTGNVLVIASMIESRILGKAKLAFWVSNCTGFLERKVIWLTERYLDEPSEEMRAIHAHCDPITSTSKYEEYLFFVQQALLIHAA